MATFDDLRAAYPLSGFAVYAYEPGGRVVLEAHTPMGDMTVFKYPTLAECIAAALPPAPEKPPPEPEPDLPSIFD